MNKTSNRVTCPYCGYKMPLSIEEHANCNGVVLSCKGRNCKRVFELVVKDGVQFKVVKHFKLISPLSDSEFDTFDNFMVF